MSHLDGIQVDIAVMLGGTSLPLGKVLEISRGAMLALGARERDALVLRANGRDVAEGRVVVTGDRVGIEVTRLIGRGL